jgi:putative transposase
MKYDPDFNHRQSIRLNGYDYSTSGAYFITICTHEREYLFGDIVNEKMEFNTFGDIARSRKRTPRVVALATIITASSTHHYG